jgi:hypothetical protein
MKKKSVKRLERPPSFSAYSIDRLTSTPSSLGVNATRWVAVILGSSTCSRLPQRGSYSSTRSITRPRPAGVDCHTSVEARARASRPPR